LQQLSDKVHASLNFTSFTSDTKGGLMAHKQRERGDDPFIAGSLEENKSHRGGSLGETMQLNTWPDSFDSYNSVNHTDASEDVTTGGVDIDRDNRGLGGHSVELLDKSGGGGLAYLADKPDEVIWAELDDLERLRAHDFFPEDYWGEY
jgi:hypothetical protein